jgi:hydroxymethylpyrimidine/phosphomethylpyrimidine kinase
VEKTRVTVCSIGSTDPTAAAGIGRDLVVYERLGVHGTYAVAAVTAQNRRRVTRVSPVSAELLASQLAAIWQEKPPRAVRIGLLPNAALIGAVARFLRSLHSRPPTVLDPVMRASSGHRFLNEAGVRALGALLPLVTIVTPNAAEAAALTGTRVRDADDMRRAGLALRSRGCAALVKGGDLSGARVIDVLVDARGATQFSAPRIRTAMRGTGCSLAAAIAAFLARGMTLRTAVAHARAFVRRELEAHRRTRAKGRA